MSFNMLLLCLLVGTAAVVVAADTVDEEPLYGEVKYQNCTTDEDCDNWRMYCLGDSGCMYTPPYCGDDKDCAMGYSCHANECSSDYHEDPEDPINKVAVGIAVSVLVIIAVLLVVIAVTWRLHSKRNRSHERSAETRDSCRSYPRMSFDNTFYVESAEEQPKQQVPNFIPTDLPPAYYEIVLVPQNLENSRKPQSPQSPPSYNDIANCHTTRY